ncbi:MAG: methyltransferase domain-containing protein [Acidobacteriota bacterium]
MAAPHAMELDIDQLMATIRESAAKRNLAARYSRTLSAAASLLTSRPQLHLVATDFPDLKLSPDFKPRKDDHYHVNDLLRFHDTHFVRNAYRAILKRDPDDAGFGGYLERLRSGSRNKVDILASLRFSAEGRQRNVRIDGLRLPALIRLISRVPVLGYFLELLIAVLRIPNSTRERRRFESYSLARAQELADYSNRLSGVIRELRHFVIELPNKIEEQRQRTEVLDQRQQQFTELVSQQAQQFTEHLTQFTEHLTQQGQQLRELHGKQQHELELQNSKLLAHENKLSDLAAAGAEQKMLGEEFNTQLADSRKALAAHSETSNQLVQALEQVRIQLAAQQARTAALLKAFDQKPLSPVQSDIFRDEDRHLLDALYLSLEDHFRGGRSEIKARFEVYLPYLQQAGISTNILDIGCGRGEWLELLSENGLEATGVDENRSMTEQCRTAGLTVTRENAIDHLRRLPDQSLGAVTIFHVIEHLGFEQLVQLIDEVVRVLRPKGLLIIETPNPENIIVGSCNFYFDPTHCHPLPIQLSRFLLEAKGLSDLKEIGLHALDSSRIQGDSELINRFNEFFYGPMDYAIIARRN